MNGIIGKVLWHWPFGAGLPRPMLFVLLLSGVHPAAIWAGAVAVGTLHDAQPSKEVLERRAHEGDPEAMYQYANVLSIKEKLERLRWYCRAAQAGHAQAQYTLGNYYRLGLDGVERNVELAYVWYSLSFEGGYATAKQYRDRLSEEMTPVQIAEAERLVAEWEPNPAECEEIAAQADN